MALTTMRMTPIVWSVNPVERAVVLNLNTTPMAKMMTLVETPTGCSLDEAATDSARGAGQVPTAGLAKQFPARSSAEES